MCPPYAGPMETIARASTPRGEAVLRRDGRHFEVIVDGVFLVDTRDGRSERALLRAALPHRRGATVLIGGLGAGFTLDEALRAPGVERVVVVEVEPLVVDWHRRYLAPAAPGVDDPRVELRVGDVAAVLRDGDERFDAICLDVDNGPGWLVHPANAPLYDTEGLARVRSRLAPGGRVAVWSSDVDPPFEHRLRGAFARVRTVRVPAPRGPDDVIYVASGGATMAPRDAMNLRDVPDDSKWPPAEEAR